MGDIFAKAQLFKALRLTNVGIFERDQGACVAYMCDCVIVSFGKDKISDNWIEHRWDITLRKLITLLQECSQLPELSLCPFRDQLEPVVGNDKRRNSYIRRVLIPLLFHMSDQSPDVAKVQGQGQAVTQTRASGEALLAAAKLLKWKELKHLLETDQTCRISLLVKDKSGAEKYLHQSLPYLKGLQATVREAAVREPVKFHFVPIGPASVIGYDWKGPGSLFFAPSLQVFKYISEIPP
ncbi:hypothetical protein HGM15179_005903 [Zosterops borbonicus]|uniref:Uncharacterized protein n=1 Tax=Zosterops borbonicus TaxID=364589 RepID=A0A8K1LP77_9PASS|nr:hypothetical protein HGM15179_005903 [Zosterops borbonicus]